MEQAGFECVESDDPFAAMLEICRRPLAYRSVVISLQSLYGEELAVIGAMKRRFPHLDIWLAHADGRQAACAEAMKLGASGLLGEGDSCAEPEPARVSSAADNGPVLTPQELRALLDDPPFADTPHA